MSLAQLVPSIAAASSNLIVSADAEDHAVARTIDNINRTGFIASSHMKCAPLVKLSRKGKLRSGPARAQASPARLQSPHEAGVDQEPVEAAGFRAVLAGIEQALAAQHDLLLLLERGIERNAGGFLDHQRQIGPVDGIHHSRTFDRLEFNSIDRVIGR